MSVSPSSRKVLLLYKDLLRYGKNIQLTDKEYYVNRVRKEFRQNKSLQNPEDIEFQYMVRRTSAGTLPLEIRVVNYIICFQKGLTLLKNRRIL